MESKMMTTLSLDDNFSMVAAFDFGTTFSGYAFSFRDNPGKVFMNKSWGENLGFQAYKTPTCLLLNDKDEKEIYFGYEAEQKYADLLEREESCDHYHMFRHFKMMLFGGGKISVKKKITAIDGTVRDALPIFSKSLQYLKNHLISALKKQQASVDEEQIRWVITVPAIWTEGAKQFMREAAYKAGIIGVKDSRQLLIALEPEAASIFCRQELDISFDVGAKYLVIDAGGGTVDLTAHEVIAEGKVREIQKASGGAWGGSKVDANFESLMEQVLGSDFIQKFKKGYPQAWLHFMVEFEKKKRSATMDEASKITVSIPYIMGGAYEEITAKRMDQEIKNKSSKTGVRFSNGMLIISHEVVLQLFNPVLDQIIDHIEVQLGVDEMSDCDYLMVVGGFGESSLLQSAIEKSFEKRAQMVVPEEAQMSVIRGAVLYGHNPDNISVRKAAMTYGMKVMQDFNPKAHKAKYKITKKNGDVLCKNVFKIFVQKDCDIELGERCQKTVRPTVPKQKAAKLIIYQCDRKLDLDQIHYTDESGCRELGMIRVEMPNSERDMDRKIEVEMKFGGTEIQVKATDEDSGQSAEAVLDFLSGEDEELQEAVMD